LNTVSSLIVIIFEKQEKVTLLKKPELWIALVYNY